MVKKMNPGNHENESNRKVMDKQSVPGPGGKTLLLGGLNIDRVLRSDDNVASINTRRELVWNACEENPKSMRATGRNPMRNCISGYMNQVSTLNASSLQIIWD